MLMLITATIRSHDHVHRRKYLGDTSERALRLREIIKLIVFRVHMQANMAGICICEAYRVDVGKGKK